ncbi:hypothetical protein BC829DRAFT_388836, partial [Chytridium lagenaria]
MLTDRLSKMPDAQTMSNPSPLRSRRYRDLSPKRGLGKMETGEVKISSTFQASYMPHDVKTARELERVEYAKNKGKAGKGGEWWGHDENKFETNSCYRDSFKEHNYRLLRTNLEAPVAGKGNTKPIDDTQFRQKWFQYRMRKPPTDDPGKHYDILTGKEIERTPAGVYAPGRRAGRVSIDKINNAEQQAGERRNYNIISNAPLNPPPL